MFSFPVARLSSNLSIAVRTSTEPLTRRQTRASVLSPIASSEAFSMPLTRTKVCLYQHQLLLGKHAFHFTPRKRSCRPMTMACWHTSHRPRLLSTRLQPRSTTSSPRTISMQGAQSGLFSCKTPASTILLAVKYSLPSHACSRTCCLHLFMRKRRIHGPRVSSVSFSMRSIALARLRMA